MIRKYKENGCNVIKRKRGYTSMTSKPKAAETIEEKVKRLEKENEYLRAENEYRKKLNAVVQARIKRESKKK